MDLSPGHRVVRCGSPVCGRTHPRADGYSSATRLLSHQPSNPLPPSPPATICLQILDSGVPLAVHGNLEMKEYSKFESGDRMATGGCKWRGQICTVNFNEFIVFKEDGHVNKYLVRLKVKDDGMTKRRIYGR